MTIEGFKRINDIKYTNIVLIVVGLLGMVGSALLALIKFADNTAIAIVLAIFSGVALLIAAIQEVERTIIETRNK